MTDLKDIDGCKVDNTTPEKKETTKESYTPMSPNYSTPPTSPSSPRSLDDTTTVNLTGTSGTYSQTEMHDFTKWQLRKLWIARFILSRKFTFLTGLLVLAFQLIQWIVYGIVQISMTNPTFDVGLTKFDSGCAINPNTAIIFVTNECFYLGITVMVFIIALFADRDTYRVKL